ncbi:MAG: type II secretion system protein GspC [Magnetococcales bacterium]|nr:type II secretion system protein GspC [Magnetococcales bacterium]
MTLNLLLLLAIAYDAWRIVQAERETVASVASVSTQNDRSGPSPTPAVSQPVWNDWRPFGQSAVVEQKASPPREPVPEDAPDTQLQLALTGVLSTSGDGRSWAVVRGGTEGEKMFATGDKLPGDARIVSVRPDRIILEKSGRFETLRLPRSVVSLEAKPAEGAKEAPVSEAVRILRQLRDQFQTQPDAVLGKIAVTPVNRDGVFGGYAVQPGSEEGLLEKLGLAPGDVITVANGVSLTSPMKGMEALGTLGKSQSLRLTFLRGGKSMSVQHLFGAN